MGGLGGLGGLGGGDGKYIINNYIKVLIFPWQIQLNRYIFHH